MSGRRETGVNPDITKAITDAIVVLEHDRSQERTAVNLAKLAGTSRPTLYRAFNDRPDLRAAFERLTNSDRLTGEQRTQVERRIIELRAENAQLRRLVPALTTVAEALKRENLALRQHPGTRAPTSHGCQPATCNIDDPTRPGRGDQHRRLPCPVVSASPTLRTDSVVARNPDPDSTFWLADPACPTPARSCSRPPIRGRAPPRPTAAAPTAGPKPEDEPGNDDPRPTVAPLRRRARPTHPQGPRRIEAALGSPR